METNRLESEGTATVERCVYVNVSAARLWDAITSRAHIDAYFLLPTACFDLAEGGEVSFGVGDDKIISGTIEFFEAPGRLEHSFAFAHYPDDPLSRVCYTVENIGPELSCLYLRHENLLPGSRTHQDVAVGWDRILSEMKSYLETGRGLNWPED